MATALGAGEVSVALAGDVDVPLMILFVDAFVGAFVWAAAPDPVFVC